MIWPFRKQGGTARAGQAFDLGDNAGDDIMQGYISLSSLKPTVLAMWAVQRAALEEDHHGRLPQPVHCGEGHNSSQVDLHSSFPAQI